MNRAKVICHMYVSTDGKIVTDLKGYPECDFAGDYYDEFTFKTSNAWGCGRETFEYLSSKGINLDDYKPTLEIKDNFIKDDIYCFSFDRKGKLFFSSPYNDYANHKSRFICVLLENVDKRFISYLNSKGISYIFAGKDEFDPKLFLEKIKSYGIDTFLLCGGPKINAVFMEKDLVDEISLVVAPGVQGGRKELTFVGSEDVSAFPKYFNLKSAKVLPENTVQLIYTKKD